MSFPIQPIEDRIVIQQLEDTDEKIGSIIVPEQAKEKPQRGMVMAVGTDEDVQALFTAGDVVVYAKYGGTEIQLKGVTYLILSKVDILAKVTS